MYAYYEGDSNGILLVYSFSFSKDMNMMRRDVGTILAARLPDMRPSLLVRRRRLAKVV